MRKLLSKISLLLLLIVCFVSSFAMISCSCSGGNKPPEEVKIEKIMMADFESENELFNYNYVDGFGTVEFNTDTTYIKNGLGSAHFLINGSPYDETQSYPPYLVLYMDEKHGNKTDFTNVTNFHFDFFNNSDRDTTLNFRFHFGSEFTPKLPYLVEKGKWTAIDIPFDRGAYNNVYDLKDVKWIEVIFENRLSTQTKISMYADNFNMTTTSAKMEVTPYRTGDNYLDVTEGSLAYWSTSYTGKIEINKDAKYIKTGAVSYKFFDNGTFDESGNGTSYAWPKIMLSSKVPAMDISGYDYLSMWIYNDSNRDIDLMSFLNLNMTTAYRKGWTLARIPINAPQEVQNDVNHPDRNKYLSTMKDGADCKYDIKDFKSFNLFHVNNPVEKITLYLDSIFLEKTASVADFEVSIPKVLTKEFAVPMPTGYSLIEASVIDPLGNTLVMANGSVTLTEYGKYAVNYVYEKDGKKGTKTYKALYMPTRPAGVVDSFESEAEVNRNTEGVNGATISYDTTKTKDDIGGSMKVVGAGVITAHVFNIPYLDFTNYGGLGFWVYNNKAVEVKVFLTQTGMNNRHIGTAKANDWTYMTLDKADFKLEVAFDMGMPNYDYKVVTFLKLLLADNDTGLGEMEVYFDSLSMIPAGYKAPTVDLGKASDTARVNTAYTMPVASIVDDLDTNLTATIKYTSDTDHTEKTLTEATFTPTVTGTYTFVYTVTDSNANIVTTQFVLTVASNVKPTITLGAGIPQSKLNELYTIPTATVTDDDGATYIPSISYSLNGGSAVAITGGAFTPTVAGTYVITYTATDTEGLATTVTYTMIASSRDIFNTFVNTNDVYCRDPNLLPTFELDATNKKDNLGSSLKASSMSHGGFLLNIKNLGATNFSNFGSIGFWMFNPDTAQPVQVYLQKTGRTLLERAKINSWTYFEITKAQLVALGYDVNNLLEIELLLQNEGGTSSVIYIDSIECFVAGYKAPTVDLGKTSDTARVNTAYTMPVASIVDDLDTNLTATIKYTSDTDPTEKTLTEATFTPTVTGTYTFVYTVTDSNANVVTTQFVLTVASNVKPTITLGAGIPQSKLNEVYTIPTATVTDDDGATYIPSISYSLNGGSAVAITGGAFTPTVAGTYVITYTATDAESQTETVTYTMIATDKAILTNNLSQSDIDKNFVMGSNATMTYSNINSRDNLGGSYKISGGDGGVASLSLKNLLVKDLTNYDGISFWVLNCSGSGINAKNVMLSRPGANNLQITTAYAGVWAKVMISKAQLLSMAPQFGLPPYDVTNLDCIDIIFGDWQGVAHDIYVDSFEAYKLNDEPGMIESFNSSDDFVGARGGVTSAEYSETHRRGTSGGALKIITTHGGTINLGFNAPIGTNTHIGLWLYNNSNENVRLLHGTPYGANVEINNGKYVSPQTWGFVSMPIELLCGGYKANGTLANLELLVVSNSGSGTHEVYFDDFELLTQGTQTYLMTESADTPITGITLPTGVEFDATHRIDIKPSSAADTVIKFALPVGAKSHMTMTMKMWQSTPVTIFAGDGSAPYAKFSDFGSFGSKWNDHNDLKIKIMADTNHFEAGGYNGSETEISITVKRTDIAQQIYLKEFVFSYFI